MIATTVSARVGPSPAQGVTAETIDPVVINDGVAAPTDAPQPPQPEGQLTGPYVSDPVAPADTRGLPRAATVDPYAGAPRETVGIAAGAMAGGVEVSDPVVQRMLGVNAMPAPIVNIEAQNNFDGVDPPDTDGQVGPNHYVQMVNLSTAVYSKTGDLLYGPFHPNDLWPWGDPCRQFNDGDVVVLYDQMADRWLLTQFAVSLGGPYYQCIAVSKGPEPTDEPDDWYPYTFLVSEDDMNDYPKLGVWPDGYYMTANQFNGTGGLGAWVFERDAMLNGDPATFQYFENADWGHGWLPSNLMGDTLPPAGSPNYFAQVVHNEVGPDLFRIYAFHTDWDTPANTTFGPVKDLVVAKFDPNMCFGDRSCIPQPDTTNGNDAISDRLMMHLWYRNMGTHEVLVANHTVDVGNDHAGIRWYEVHNPGANAILVQQSTFAPDEHHRWMGSIAMDKVGNMALGYSISSDTLYPSIRYTGREAGDPLGYMSLQEGIIITGTGSKTNPSRWGDYSAMSVDPVDDCTFWYTQEYIETTGTWNWQTRIASFRFPNCMEERGTLDGTVYGDGSPIGGAKVTAETADDIYIAYSHADGSYGLDNLPSGTYTATAEAYGYMPDLVSGVVVTAGMTTVQDFSLTSYPTYTVSGVVTDTATGWPLYASITIEGYMYRGTVWTDPVTGQYDVTLAGDPSAYTFTVSAWVVGYEPEVRSVGPLTANATENFALGADEGACSAPGYVAASTVYAEDFEASGVFTPTGEWEWGVPSVWPFGCGSGTMCWGTDLDSNYDDNVDETITSPVIDLSAYAPGTALAAKWQQAWDMEEGFDYAMAEVSINGGPWTVMWAATTFGEWTEMGYDVSAAAGGTVQLRFRLVSDGGVNFRGYYIDDVRVTEGCAPTAGGLVVGNVYDEATSSPQVGSVVQNESGRSFQAAATPGDPAVDDAFYTLFSPAGTQVFTATGTYGYAADVESVAVVVSDTVGQDFYLPTAANYVVEGVVTDSTTGWPLYARITVGGTPVAPFWNDPVTGYYSVTLAAGGPYNFIVIPWVAGYDTGSIIVNSLTGDTTLDLDIDADAMACNAPGYEVSFQGFYAGFESGVPPTGWSVIDNAGNGVVWDTSANWGDGNYTGGSGEAATCNSDVAGTVDFDTELRTPTITVASLLTTTLSYLVNYQNYGGLDFLDLDISVDGGMWQNLLSWNEDHGAFYGTPGEQVELDLYTVISTATDFQLRWHYYDPNTDDWDWYAQIDDVLMGYRLCGPPPGGLVVGNVYDANTGDPLIGAMVDNEDDYSAIAGPTADAAVDEAFYTIFSPAGTKTFTATISGGGYGTDAHAVTAVASDTVGLEAFDLPAGVLGASSTGMSVVLPSGMTETLPLTLSNTGGAPINFGLVEWQPGDNPTTVQHTSFRLLKYAKAETLLPSAQVDDPKEEPGKTPTSKSPLAAGDVLDSWDTGLTSAWGAAFDRLNGTVWVGSPCAGWGGDCRVVEYEPDGTPTERWYSFPWGPFSGPADMAYNPNTGMIWVMDVGTDNCIHELDPDFGWTGDTICGFTTTSMRGLAYNPDADVFYTGRWDYGGCANGVVCQAIIQFKGETWDHPGEPIAIAPLLGVDISGLAYHSDAESTFVVESGSNLVREYDLSWTEVTSFTTTGLSANGMGINCEGNLWMASGVSDMLLVDSDRPADLCPDLPWLSEDPITGTIGVGSSTLVDVTFDAGAAMPGMNDGMLRVNNGSPYGPVQIPVELTVIHQPTWGKEVYINGEMVDVFPATAVASDTVEIVDTVSITPNGNITFTLTEEWSESLDLVDWGVYALPGGTVIPPTYGTVLFPSSGSMVVEVSDAPSAWTYVITKTFTVLDVGAETDTITETLWMENTYPQLDPVVLQFISERVVYLPLVTRNY